MNLTPDPAYRPPQAFVDAVAEQVALFEADRHPRAHSWRTELVGSAMVAVAAHLAAVAVAAVTDHRRAA